MSYHSQAAVALAPGEKLQIVDISVAGPRPREVAIELEATGICHSDLNFLSGDFPHRFPAVFGHEGIGRVVAIGHEVRNFTVGDRVMPFVIPHCGACAYCASGKTNHCVEFQRSFRDPDSTPFSLNGQKVAAFFGVGSFSRMTVVRDDQVVKVNSAAVATEAACIACGVTTGLGSALKTAAIDPGNSVAIFGAGGVGLSAIQGARIAGASTIVVVDINPAKEALARELGATHFVNAAETDVVERIKQITGGMGVDHAFECVGNAKLTQQAFASTPVGWGEVISVGMISEAIPLGIGLNTLRNHVWKRTLMGSAVLDDVAQYVDWAVEGKVCLDGVVSHVLPLSQINEAIDLMHHGEAAKVVIDYSL
jgi:S-(hydroxymethyl)glutathione dehydrogenase/alcohol dehydrogenase